MNRKPFGVDEWYHCFTRGVDKRRTFERRSDYRRFQQILYLANSVESVHRSNLGDAHEAIFQRKRGAQLVSVAAYCIMPNHFHLVLQEIRDGGIAKFMQKVGTAYAMYYNIKNERVGNLFLKPFRSKHIDSDEYLHHVVQYVHLNAAELFEKSWKTGAVKNVPGLENKVMLYEYSSLNDYYAKNQRSERAIVSDSAFDFFGSNLPPLRAVLGDAAAYYRDLTL